MSVFPIFIVNFLLQMLFSLGFIFIFGAVIAVCNSKIYGNFGSKGRAFCIATGWIGTPVHEAAHALACLIFGHKIVEIKFFIPDSSDGTLGYVSHTYNPKNPYQKMGNFFIGIAPIIVGAVVLSLLLYLFLPSAFSGVFRELNDADFLGDVGDSLKRIGKALVTLFSYAGTWQWWVFLILGSFIAMHMTLSKADIHGAATGLIVYIVLFAAIDLILAFVSQKSLSAFTGGIVTMGTILLFFFCLFVLIAVVWLIISKIVSLFVR